MTTPTTTLNTLTRNATAYQFGRLDCRLALSPAYVETPDGGFLRHPDRSRLETAEQKQTARDYLAGYRSGL